MSIIDSRGRLFGKVSILDLAAGCIILLVIVGIFFFPGTSGTTIAQVKTKPVEVDVIVRGLGVKNPDAFLEEFADAGKVDIIIRNQPAGEVEVKDVVPLPRTTVVPQPDGSVKALPDPRPEVVYFQDMIITLVSQGQVTGDGEVVLGNAKKVKIGTTVELEGLDYNFNSSVIDVRVLNQ